ncbi:MAG: rhomboid family intramembrane serine protease [Proteobacteria bacterium]|nr:rhomboid family intramembrane serine protease [Pseudomonadota bacterium]
MIPIRDTIPSRNYPVVNNTLILLNVLFFIFQYMQGDNLGQFIYIYGIVPAKFSVPAITIHFSMPEKLFSLVSYMFLHGGFWHLLSNMWSLYIFGDNVEDHFGSIRYLAFYLLCGIGSGLFHLFLNIHANVPTIGASGAIAGVMGAYLILYPRSRILTLIPIIIIPWFIEIPAFFFLGFWFLMQFINATGSDAMGGGIAWWAHIGGFLCGILLLKLTPRIPDTGFTERLRTVTMKKKTPRLQVIQTAGVGEDPNLYGTIVISPFEAVSGTTKLVNIPWGYYKRLYRISIPPGISSGKILRLKGMGKQPARSEKGDMMLRVIIS